jgi:hypothetical protein
MITQSIQVPRRRHGRRPRPQGATASHRPHRYSVSDFVFAYVAAVLVNTACLLLVPPVLMLVYPITGICLSRFIDRRITWLRLTASLQNISQAKLQVIGTWPASIPAIIWQLIVVKFL